MCRECIGERFGVHADNVAGFIIGGGGGAVATGNIILNSIWLVEFYPSVAWIYVEIPVRLP